MFQLVYYVYYSMSNLKNLESLIMSGNKFSERLPDVLTSMTSLKKLGIRYCELPTLPERLVKATDYEIQINCFIWDFAWMNFSRFIFFVAKCFVKISQICCKFSKYYYIYTKINIC